MQTTNHQAATRETETAPNIRLPQPGSKRIPVGTILIVLWVVVFLIIFWVLAQLTMKGAPTQPQIPSPIEQTSGQNGPGNQPSSPPPTQD